jgi:kynurenine 3-monooxygenase
METHFTIVGSGLAGALMACYLGKAGQRVDMYEKRPDPRSHGAERGRSINLALSLRGIQALEEVGLAERVLKDAIPMPGRMIHAPTGETTFQPYGKSGQAINSVSRAGLNLTLIEAAAQYPAVRLFFDQRCTGLDLQQMTVELAGVDGSNRHEPFDVLIGADGAYSAVRATLQKQERFNFQQDYLSHGYKELSIPAGHGGSFQMEKNALHIWPRHSFMMIALPNSDGSFTCTLFWAYEGPNSFGAIRNETDLLSFFKAQFPDAVPLMPTLAEDYFHNPIGPLVTMRCQPWHHDGRVVLLGDAAHAVVPFLGQGMNAAFEDCTVLARCLSVASGGRKLPVDALGTIEKQGAYAPRSPTERGPGNLAEVFGQFEAKRKQHADALADMAVANFYEMRDHVASRWFLVRKKLQILLYTLFPSSYVPLYNMIQFTTTPYADARRRARKQEAAVRWLCLALVLVIMAVIGLVLWRV